MQIVVVVRGPCYGGKTTVARLLSESSENMILLELDEIKKELSGSTSPSDSNPEMHSWEIARWFSVANDKTRKALEEEKDVILDEAFWNKYLFDIAIMGLRDTAEILVAEFIYPLWEHVKRYEEASDEEKRHQTPEEVVYWYKQHEACKEIENHMSFNDLHKDTSEIVGEIKGKIAELKKT